MRPIRPGVPLSPERVTESCRETALLQTTDRRIVFSAHSNYGMPTVFAPPILRETAKLRESQSFQSEEVSLNPSYVLCPNLRRYPLSFYFLVH